MSQTEIEHVLRENNLVFPDPHLDERRYFTAGQTPSGRHVFVVFTHREREAGMFIRPISERYMHRKEVEKYEKAKTMADFKN